ncbi:MAG: hypothetical protein ACRC2T_15900 [Thermoguttaceae bacterium]
MKKTVLLFFVVLLLCNLIGSTSTCFAQNQEIDWIELYESPTWRLKEQGENRAVYRSNWEGRGSWLPLRMAFRMNQESYLNLTPEQDVAFAFLRKDNELAVEWFQKKIAEQDPQLMAAMQAQQESIPSDPNNITEEEREKFLVAQQAVLQLWFDDMQNQVETTLTPEQMEKVRTLELTLLPEMGFPNPAMFESLGLTDLQKEEMEKIKADFEAEYDALIDEHGKLKDEVFIETAAELRKLNMDGADAKKWQEAMRETQSKVFRSDKIQRKSKEINARGSKFATQLKNELMNVLTDEQLDKMQKMQDNAPDFVKEILSGMRESREQREKSNTYVPGPDSWRPGDGTPEDFKNERKGGRFPKKN